MDKTAKYRRIIREVLQEKASLTYANAPELHRRLFVSNDQNTFILMAIGWIKKKYKHVFVYHVEIVNEKVWIHQDNTDVGIASVFTDLGVKKNDIILGFLPKYARMTSEFAEAS